MLIFFSFCSTNKITLLFTAFLPWLHLNKQMHTKHKNKMAKHMAYFFSSSSLCFWVTTNKNNHKSLYIACSHPAKHNYQTDCLPRSKISMIHQDKIKPYSQLHVSMTSLTKFFTSAPMHCPGLFFLFFIGC